MKVVYLLKAFPRLSETFILTEILELERRGVEVAVFSRYGPAEEVPHAALRGLAAEIVNLEPLLRERYHEPFEIHRRLARRLPASHEASLDLALAHRNREEIRYWLLAAPVAEWALDHGVDHIHAHFATGSASVARYASRISGIPFSFTAHAKDIYASDVDLDRLRLLLDEAAVAVTISDANRRHLEGLSASARVSRTYNGIDLGRFEWLPRPPAPETPLVLSVARFVEKKGLADLLGAIALLRHDGSAVRCRLVGSGPLEESLRDLAGTLGIADAVEFHGPASQEDVSGLHLPAASAFALPCVVAADGDRDGIPTTLLESMARGVPVVSTRLPGIDEAVPDGAGLLVEPGDVPALARAISATLADRDAAARRARVARRHIEERFDCRKNAALLLETFAVAEVDGWTSAR